ncbi:MAG: PAS domain-containing sensor histidine kinase [Bacteroidetes bacterium]|nr:MAG: PAS domain-containing sensor histidine kinase [Bacteroidota bacterium]
MFGNNQFISQQTSSYNDTELSLNTYAALLDSNERMHFFIGKNFRVLWYNSAAEKHFKINFDISLSVNKNFLEYTDEDNVIVFKNLISRCLNGEKIHKETSYFLFGKYKVWYEMEMNPVKDDFGKTLGVSFFCNDITTKKKNIEFQEILSKVADKTQSAVIITDIEGKITWVNHSFFICTEYQLEEVIGKKPGEVLQGPNTDIETIRNFSNAIKNLQPFQCELYNYSKSGRGYWLYIHMTPFYEDNELVGFLAIENDITHLKSQLQEIENSVDRYKQINETKDKLLSMVSHDVRAPIHQLKMLIEFYNSDTIDVTVLKEQSKNVLNSLDSIINFLNNLMNWTHSQSNGFKFKADVVDINSLIDDKTILFKPMTDLKNIKITNNIKPNTYIYIDENCIRLVVRNLLSNALKFTRPNGEIIFDIENYEDEVVIKVSDTGVGISNDKINKIFDGDYTTNGTNKEKGTGLGLKLCKEFIELSGGKIWAESVENQGSTFCFSARKIVENN